jgi:acyl-coenzyme A thioesterase PaaI-like protein
VWYAALSKAPSGSEVLTAELKVNLLAPVAGAVLVQGRVVRAGRTLSVCQGDAYDAEDPSRHLATMLLVPAQ